MTFLNGTLLIACAAALVPIVLHFIGKREPQRIVFPAVQFLTKRIETTRRRFQIKRWVLLALRVAMIGGLGLALAQPQIDRADLGTWLSASALALFGLLLIGLAVWGFLRQHDRWLGWGLGSLGLILIVIAFGWTIAAWRWPANSSPAKGTPAAVAILLDNGPTSSYQETAERNRFEKGREFASWIIGRYSRTSRFALLDRSSRPGAFAMDVDSLQRSLEKIAIIDTPRPLGERIDAAVALLQTSDLAQKSLFVLCDLAQSGWNAAEHSQSPAIDSRSDPVMLPSITRPEKDVTIYLVDLGADDDRNRFLENVTLIDPTPPPESPATLLVSAGEEMVGGKVGAGQGDQAPGGWSKSELTVQLRLFRSDDSLPAVRDGKVQYPELRTNDRATIRIRQGHGSASLTIPPLGLGIHHGIIELLDPDPLMCDNRRFFTIQVTTPRKILVVCDDLDTRRILSAMLNPHGEGDARCEYQIASATMEQLLDMPLDGYVAIGLFNPRLPSPPIRGALDRWVAEGGQLFVALGPAIDQGTPTSVPWPLIGNPQRIWRIPDPGSFAEVMQDNHSAMMQLTQIPGGAPWSAFRIYHYWQITDQANWQTMLRVAGTSHLLLGESMQQAGRVILLTTPLPALDDQTRPWNDLMAVSSTGAWEVYVVLLQQIFEDLSGGLQVSLNTTVGNPVVLNLPSTAPRRWQLFSPAGSPVLVESSQSTVVPGTPLAAGHYWLRGNDRENLGYSANLPLAGTRLARLAEADLRSIFGETKYQLLRDREEIDWGDGGGTEPLPLYPLLMLFLFGIFILESILANRLSQGKRHSSLARTAARPAITAASPRRSAAPS